MRPDRAFELLDLARSASPDDVEAAWRTKRSEAHPDKGGDAAKFAELRLAYLTALNVAREPRLCERCNGSGRIELPQRGGFVAMKAHCADCNGTGKTA